MRKMPKAGRYDYPARTLDDCVKYLIKAHEVTKSHDIKRDTFAQANGVSHKGGGFGLLIGSLGMYKLATTGDGYVRYTDLAKKILHGEAFEKAQSKSDAVRNVMLFSDIADQFGKNVTDEQLRIFLRDKANAEIDEANHLSVEVRKLFKSVAQHIESIDDSQGGDSKKMQVGMKTKSVGNGLFTVIAQGLEIDVDSMLNLNLVEQIVKDARTKLEKQESDETEVNQEE